MATISKTVSTSGPTASKAVSTNRGFDVDIDEEDVLLWWVYDFTIVDDGLVLEVD